MADYKTQLHEDITKLQQATRRGEMPREVRLGKIEALAESYWIEAGEWPDGVALERMADLILFEEIYNPSLTKMQDEEYPIMSERQYDRRQQSEFATGDRLDSNAADGGNHAVPVRRNRSDYENRFLDKRAKSRNKERKRRYTEFTKTQPVTVYFNESHGL